MRPIKRLIQVDEALKIALAKTEPMKRTERVSLLSALGRVSAEPIVSKVSVPPFSRSAMDGYALRAADTFSSSKSKSVMLRINEVIYAGGVPKKKVVKGVCAEIATGAMLPQGADAVVMVENTELKNGSIVISEPVHPGQHVSRKGEDIEPGNEIISEGEVFNPSKIGAVAAVGIKTVKVFAKPLVAVVPTGNEIAELGTELRPGQVYNINSYTLSTMIMSNGGEPRITQIVNDSMDDLEAVVKANSDCDLMLFSGGSSVGERDIMLDVLEKQGDVLYHGVAMKPGKPTLFGVIRRQLVFGMPGYPTSCLSNAYVFVAPVLRKMARLPSSPPAAVKARMSKRVVSTTGRTQFLTVKLKDGVAHPAFKESGAITSMAYADGYVVIPADVDLLEKEEEVTVYLL
jgi:molybdenum cofactor synthesis domain-containing protein